MASHRGARTGANFAVLEDTTAVATPVRSSASAVSSLSTEANCRSVLIDLDVDNAQNKQVTLSPTIESLAVDLKALRIKDVEAGGAKTNCSAAKSRDIADPLRPANESAAEASLESQSNIKSTTTEKRRQHHVEFLTPAAVVSDQGHLTAGRRGTLGRNGAST